MTNVPLNSATLDQIIKQTINAIEEGKEQIYDIAESAKREYLRVKKEFEEVKVLAASIITEVDSLEAQSKRARIRLMEVNREFTRFSEESARSAYENAQDIQIRLAIARERELNLRRRRDELELSLRSLQTTVDKAENLVSQVGVAMEYLRSGLQHFTEQMENMQQKQSMGFRIIKAQEDERRRVAREIHDGPAQVMANVVIRSEICEKLLDVDLEKVRDELKDLKLMVKSSLQDIRRIIFDLRPMTLDDLGLIPAVKRYLENYKDKNNIDTEVVVLGPEKRFEPTLEVALFRIIQEALSNIKKHAQASKVSIKIDVRPKEILITVIDNGKGFDLQKIVQNASTKENFGLMNMKERTELLNGTYDIQSAPGKGTRISVKVTLEN